MNYCKECGKKLEEGVNLDICRSCSGNVINPEPKKRSKKTKNKFLIPGIITLLLLMLGTHMYLKNHYSPLKKIKAMETALLSDSVEDFSKQFDYEEGVLLDKKSFLEYVKEEEWSNNIQPELKQYIATIKTNKSMLSYSIAGSASDKFIIIEPKAVLLGLYHDYKFRVLPSNVRINADLPNTEISINKKSIKSKDGFETLLKAYPGTYDISAISKNEYGTLETKDTMVVTADTDYVYNIEFDGDIYDLNSYGYGDAIVFINDKSTGKTINELGEIGPFANPEKIRVHAVAITDDKKKIISKIVDLKDVASINFEFDEGSVITDDEKIDDVRAAEFIIDYRSAYGEAVNTGNYDAVRNYIVPGSSADKELAPYVNKIKANSYEYTFIDNNILSVVKKNDFYEVLVSESLEFDNNSKDSKGYYYTKLKQNKLYEVVNNNGEYKLQSIKYFKEDKLEDKIYY